VNSWLDIVYLNSKPIYLWAMICKSYVLGLYARNVKNFAFAIVVFNVFIYFNQKIHWSLSHRQWHHINTLSTTKILFIYSFNYFCDTRCINYLAEGSQDTSDTVSHCKYKELYLHLHIPYWVGGLIICKHILSEKMHELCV
jgi:hypothetical protein